MKWHGNMLKIKMLRDILKQKSQFITIILIFMAKKVVILMISLLVGTKKILKTVLLINLAMIKKDF